MEAMSRPLAQVEPEPSPADRRAAALVQAKLKSGVMVTCSRADGRKVLRQAGALLRRRILLHAAMGKTMSGFDPDSRS